MFDVDEFIDTIRDREESFLFALLFALITAFSIGAEYAIHLLIGTPRWGIFAILVMFFAIGLLGLLIAREKREIKQFEALSVEDAARQAELAIKERDGAVNNLESLKADNDRLASALENDRQVLASLRQVHEQDKASLTKCQADFEQVDSQYEQVLAEASSLVADLKASEEGRQALEQQVSHLQEQVKKASQASAGKWEEEKQKLLSKCRELAPYYQFYKDYEGYKQCESVFRSNKTALQEKEEAKARGQKHKQALDAFFNDNRTA